MTAINLKVSKLLEMFKGLKSDAVPRAPRPSSENVETENDSSQEQEEEIVIEPEPDDDFKKQKKPKKTFFKTKKTEDIDDDEKPKKKTKERSESTSSVNVQATGNVYNIVNAKGVRLGNDYYFGPVSMAPQNKTGREKKYEEEEIEKDNLIKLVMEAKIKPDHDYIDYISKNLGKNWHCFFRSLGFSQGRIETAEINAAGYDISEARYKLLLDWINNEDDGSLGRLTTLLWEEGERSIVKNLSVMYKKSKKR